MALPRAHELERLACHVGPLEVGRRVHRQPLAHRPSSASVVVISETLAHQLPYPVGGELHDEPIVREESEDLPVSAQAGRAEPAAAVRNGHLGNGDIKTDEVGEPFVWIHAPMIARTTDSAAVGVNSTAIATTGDQRVGRLHVDQSTAAMRSGWKARRTSRLRSVSSPNASR